MEDAVAVKVHEGMVQGKSLLGDVAIAPVRAKVAFTQVTMFFAGNPRK